MPYADFSHVKSYVKEHALFRYYEWLQRAYDTPTLISLRQNPALLEGIQYADEAHARLGRELKKRYESYGRKYFWMAGGFENKDLAEDTDDGLYQVVMFL